MNFNGIMVEQLIRPVADNSIKYNLISQRGGAINFQPLVEGGMPANL